MWSGMLRQESTWTREEEQTLAPGTPVFPSTPLHLLLEPPQGCSKRQAFPGWFPWQQLRGLGEGRREGEAGPAAGRCYAAERESIMPAGAGRRTTARPNPPGLRNDSSNQSSGWWCRSITLHIPAHPTLTAYEGGTPAAVILSPEMQTKAQRS